MDIKKTEAKICMQKLDQDAKDSATNHVVKMLQRPGTLEKVEQYKRRLGRKKASVEALLKSAMQSQLDGVRTGLNQLQTCLTDLKKVETSVKFLHSLFTEVPKVYTELGIVREEHMRHSQYVTAMENLKYIFTVPESVEKTKQWINEGKLLHTHQCLTDLENSRDDLLYELHKYPNQSPHDKLMLKAYFADVETLSALLEKQLKLVLSRTLNTVRKEPTEIVTALRIIEREEKADTFALQQQRQTGFLAPGRPKRWRKMAFEVFERAVSTRIEGTQVDEREQNKMWLVRYLELTRQLILEDLRVVKTLCIPCFPPCYDIFNKYVNVYHTCLSRHLQELIQNGLEGNEYVSMLAWVLNTYAGTDLMGNSELNIEKTKLGPLLSANVLSQLQNEYLENMENNYLEWMTNTLTSEKQEWLSSTLPEDANRDGYFVTSAPVIIFQMIDQNLQVTKTISQDLTNQALFLSVDQVTKFGNAYQDAIVEFKNKHFEDRSKMPLFTQSMITIVNNCLQFMELGQKLKEHYWQQSASDTLDTKFENLLSKFITLRNETGKYLLDEAFLDLEKHFDDIFTQKWLVSSGTANSVDVICVTLEDYFQDYNHLSEQNYEYIVHEAQNLVAKRYITAILSKKITFKSYEESASAGKKVVKEIQKIKGSFSRVAASTTISSPFDIILTLSEVLKCEDADMLSLDLHEIVDKYPDITEDHLRRLLYLRGDMPQNEIREKIAFAVQLTKPKTNQAQNNSIIKQIVFVDRIINW